MDRDPQTAFSTNVGLASLFEKYERQPDTNNALSLQVGYNFSQQLGKTTKFLHDLTGYPSLEEFSSYQRRLQPGAAIGILIAT